MTGCPQHHTIAEIQRNPGRYQDKEVTVAGVVRDSYGLSIPGTNIGGGAYKIDDGTGEMWIIVSDKSVPNKGTELAVHGRISSGVSIKGRNYGLAMYEDGRHYGKR